MENGFRAFHRAEMSSQDTSKHCWLHFSSKNEIRNLKTPYLRRVTRTCIYSVQVGTVLIVLIRSLRPKAHVIATSYLFPLLQNCEDLSIKHNIDLVSKTVFGLKR